VQAGEPRDPIGDRMTKLMRVDGRLDAGAATDPTHRPPDRLAVGTAAPEDRLGPYRPWIQRVAGRK
jgi:hypothetical protein